MTSQIEWTELTPNADKWVPAVIWEIDNLTAGTTYTFKVQIYNSTAGTFTLEGTAIYTKFLVALLSKANLT